MGKKQPKFDELYHKLDHHTPNFPRIIEIIKDRKIIASIRIKAYLHETTSKYNNMSFRIIDIDSQFDNKGKKKYNIKPKPIKSMFTDRHRLHVFIGHDCVAEVVFRGIMQDLKAKSTMVTFHVSHN